LLNIIIFSQAVNIAYLFLFVSNLCYLFSKGKFSNDNAEITYVNVLNQ